MDKAVQRRATGTDSEHKGESEVGANCKFFVSSKASCVVVNVKFA